MVTARLERQYLSTERAMSMTESEPLAPPEYSDGTATWRAGLGNLVECPTCAGNGRTTCKKCKGQQKIPCARCHQLSVSRPTCGACQGLRVLGSQPCGRCEGRGYENPCLTCTGTRTVSCSECIGLGHTTCQLCDGNSKVYQVDVASKRYEASSSITWHQHPVLPNGVVAVLERLLPCGREETLDKPEGSLTEVLAMRRLHHAGEVEIVRFTRFLTTTMVASGGQWAVLPRYLAKSLPWFSTRSS
jgi:hypothetical protein